MIKMMRTSPLLNWRVGAAAITVMLVLAIVMVLAIYGTNPISIYNSLTPTYSFSVIANFSDGNVNQTMMQEMIKNTFSSALSGFITLTKPPYPIINVKPFKNTLVTFQLPNNYGYRYASIIVHEGVLYVYLWNSANDYKLYAVVKRPMASVRVEIIYPREGNFTPVGIFRIEKFVVPLPGLSSANDPEVYFESYSAVWYIGSAVAANTTAAVGSSLIREFPLKVYWMMVMPSQVLAMHYVLARQMRQGLIMVLGHSLHKHKPMQATHFMIVELLSY